MNLRKDKVLSARSCIFAERMEVEMPKAQKHFSFCIQRYEKK